MKKSIQAFFSDDSKWQEEYQFLRKIIQQTNLPEELKWGKPCYTFNGRNVVLIHGFKNYCALLFHKGVLINDPEHVLIQQTKHVQAARQLRFKNLQEIKSKEKLIKSYLLEAIKVELSGKEVPMKKTKDYEVVDELAESFQEDPNFQKAFNKLTPGRQRGYLLYFSNAKQSNTRQRRIHKCRPKILKGKGLRE